MRATSWWWPVATAAAGRPNLTLRGEVDGKPQTYTYRDLTFAERGGQEFIARLWAQRKIGYLLAQIRLHGVKDELVQEIVTLSSRYGIVTPYTSFLVQEPSLALSQEGRDQLGRALQGLPPPGGRGGGSAGAPTAAPAAMEPLVGGDRSGQAAVEKAVAEQALKRPASRPRRRPQPQWPGRCGRSVIEPS